MEVFFSHGGLDLEEKRVAESNSKDFVLKIGRGKLDLEDRDYRKPCSPEQVPFFTAIEKISMKPYVVESSIYQKENIHDQLQFTRAEMEVVREENQKLKTCIDRIKRDYEILQTKIFSIKQDETNFTEENDKNREIDDESELVSLSLGTSPRKNEVGKSQSKPRSENEEGLSLGLETTLFEASLKQSDSHGKRFEELKEVEAAETWPPSKVLKARKSSEESEISERNVSKKARVSVRARCETPTMNDGCQWRKYGQKIAKGNPCPRAYYRCTGSPTCPVRKQVQRCAEDMRILTSTYEGNHNHHLPPSATAMASTTSAAASMLLSGSSISQSGSNTSSISNLHGLNFHLSDPTTNPRQSYFSSSSSSSSHPTITLDLTSSNPSSSSTFSQRYSSNNLSFGSWNSNGVGTLDYGGKFLQDNIFQTLLQKNYSGGATTAPPSHQASPGAIAAATKAITADPSFQSALKAAISLIIDSDNSHGVSQKMKWQEEPFFSVSKPKESGFSSNLMNKAPSI